MSGMAEVIADALAEWPADDSAEEHAVRVAAALTAAGFGSVAEAKAGALEESADVFGENQTIREGDVKEWLRARATAVRGEG